MSAADWIARRGARLEDSPVGDAMGAAAVLVIYVAGVVITAGVSGWIGQT